MFVGVLQRYFNDVYSLTSAVSVRVVTRVSRDVTKFSFLSVRNLDLGIAYCAVLKVTPGIDRTNAMSGATGPSPTFSGAVSINVV